MNPPVRRIEHLPRHTRTHDIESVHCIEIVTQSTLKLSPSPPGRDVLHALGVVRWLALVANHNTVPSNQWSTSVLGLFNLKGEDLLRSWS